MRHYAHILCIQENEQNMVATDECLLNIHVIFNNWSSLTLLRGSSYARQSLSHWEGQSRQTFIINIFSCIWHLLSLILTVLQFTVFWIPTWYRQNLFWVHLCYWEGQVMLDNVINVFTTYYVHVYDVCNIR